MEQFEKWLLELVSNSSAYKYSRAINSISNDMIEEKILSKILYDYTELIELNFIIDNILNNDKFVEKNQIGHNMYSCALKYFIIYTNNKIENNAILFTQDDDSFVEGKEKLRQHIVRERNQELINKAKEKFKAEHDGKLFCEVCDFDFYEVYGGIGEDFIEAHHTKPVSEMVEGEKTNIDDISMVCSNCHSMVHRRKPWLTKEKLKEIIL